MYRVQMTALAIGLVLLVTRAPGVWSPRLFTRWIKEHVLARDDAHLRFYGFAIAIIGALLVYLLLSEVDWLQAVTLAMVLSMLVWGVMTLFFPEVARAPVRAMTRQPAISIRVVCAVSVIIALYLIWFGWQGF